MEEEKYKKRQRLYRAIMLVAVTMFITSILTTAYIANKFDLGTGTETIASIMGSSSDADNVTASLKNIENIIDKYYLYDVNEQDAIDGAIEGYIESLGDPYTEYIPAKQMEEYTQQITGNYVGIGIYMTKNTEKNTIDVISPIKESPAEEVGILPGDSIIKVDGVEYTADDMTTVANKIKGEEGTKVTLEIRRGDQTLTFEITRRKINTNPVVSEKIEDESTTLENNIGYLEVSSFDEGTAEDFKAKFEELKSQGITSLIIDLRNNGGGLVNEALKIADYIAPKDSDLLITVDKNKKEEIEKAKEDPIINMPIVVLVNGNTASASEILSGALKDLGKATIVGTKTYGKGVIQQILSLSSGAGLKVTVEEYYTPNRTQINKIGIEPDEVVELPETVKNPLTVTKDQDTQLQKAIEILKGAQN